jgi:hypothetical protein
MSFDLLDTTGGRLVIRRPDGATYFDSDWRVPAQLGEMSVNRRVVISAIPGERIEPAGDGRFRYVLPAPTIRNVDVDLGPVPGGITPNYLLANFKGTRVRKDLTDSTPESQGVLFNMSLILMVRTGEWVPINASSIWLERMTGGSNDRDVAQRIGTLVITGAVPRFTFRIREAARSFRSGDFSTAIRSGSSSTWNFSFKIAWGVYDLGG